MYTNDKTIWTKISGAGNSFWIAHFPPPISPSLIKKDWPRAARELCRKKADGLVVLLPSKLCDFKWLFYNSDGSPAEMCGNAACCVTDYVFKKQLVTSDRSSFTFETIAQKITGKRVKGCTRIFLQQDQDIQGPFEASFNKERFVYMFINSGVPHAVIEIPEWPKDLKEWKNKKDQAKTLRKESFHHKNGMNVSFYCQKKTGRYVSTASPLQNNKESQAGASPPQADKEKSERQNPFHTVQLRARSFERGVEDFTPACGTGALAVAQVYRHQCGFHCPAIEVQMPGGLLEIGFHPDKTISLMSPVKWLQEISTPT